MAQGAENIGFALPVSVVKKDIESVKSKGKIVQPFLGIRYSIITKAIQTQNNLPYGYGAIVLRGERVTRETLCPRCGYATVVSAQPDPHCEQCRFCVDGCTMGFPEFEIEGVSVEEVIGRILSEVPVPRSGARPVERPGLLRGLNP
jgi:hypothetical protein